MKKEIEKTKDDIKEALEKMKNEMEKKMEVIIESGIQQLVIVKKLEQKQEKEEDQIKWTDVEQRGDTAERSPPRKRQRQDPELEENRRVDPTMELQAVTLKLKGLRNCHERIFKDEQWPFTNKEGKPEAMEKLAEVGLQGGEEEKGSVEEINREMEAATDIVIEMEEMIDQLSDKEIELNQELEDRRTPKREMKEEEEESDLQGITGQIQPRVQLPPSRIPAFSGKSWDWENFWQLFEHNIHNQPVSEVIKFNFLLDAVPAEIKETIGRFRISREGYDEAINWLKRHYERDDIIIEQLYTKLETTQNTGNSTAEQRRLFNQIATTVTQLRNKGQDVNHRQLLTQITRKFEERIQEKIIAKKAELIQSNLWNWDSLREVVEDALSRRELIEEMRELERRRGEPRENPTQGIRKAAPREKGPACLYCKRTNHPARECRAVPENERISFFKRNNLCLNCGRNNHMVAECWSQNCRRCGRKHHISLCGIRSETTSATQPRMENEQQTQAPPPTPTNKGSTSQRRSQRGQRQGENAGHSVQNLVESEQEHEDHVGKRRPRKEKSKKEEKKKKEHKKEAQPNRKTTHLLSGTVQIRGPYESREVGILLDTGSELSFIDSKLADDLKLPVLAKKTLRINTFGSNETKQDDYEQIQVEVNGEKDNTHSLRLFKSNIIIKASPQANLQREDWRPRKKSQVSEENAEPRRNDRVSVVTTAFDNENLNLISRNPSTSGETLGTRGARQWRREPPKTIADFFKEQEKKILRVCNQTKFEVLEMKKEIEKTKDDIKEALEKMKNEMEKKMEVIIESGIQQLVIVKKLEQKQEKEEDQIKWTDVEQRGDTAERSPPRKRQRQDPELEENRRVDPTMELQAVTLKLKGLRNCHERIFKDEQWPFTNKEGKPVRCVFCEATGYHLSDNCPNVRLTEERKQIVKTKEVCWFCLKGHQGECFARRQCAYCASTNHHQAICYLPEERKKWENRRKTLQALTPPPAGGMCRSSTE
ncbi:hypothetical protein GCK32_008183, partial [Trichostrongylus colubriformis]